MAFSSSNYTKSINLDCVSPNLETKNFQNFPGPSAPTSGASLDSKLNPTTLKVDSSPVQTNKIYVHQDKFFIIIIMKENSMKDKTGQVMMENYLKNYHIVNFFDT